MIEAAVSLAGIVILWFVAIAAHGLTEDSGPWKHFLYAWLGGGALYFLVRFLRWAWETPFL